MSVQRMTLVAWHVFKENVRDRVLYAIAAFAAVLVAASILIGQMTAGQDVKIIKDLGLATIELSGILMSLFLGVGLVAREIERRSIYALLAKPLPRWEFIVGKYGGLILTLAVNVVAMTLVLFAVLAVLDWFSPESVRLSWSRPATDPLLAVAVVEIMAELAVLTAVALFFSTFSSSTVLSLMLSTGVLIAGLLSDDLRNFGAIVDAPGPLTTVVTAVGWLLPAFSAFDLKGPVVSGLPIDGGRVALTLVYGFVYASATVAASVAVFSRREFK